MPTKYDLAIIGSGGGAFAALTRAHALGLALRLRLLLRPSLLRPRRVHRSLRPFRLLREQPKVSPGETPFAARRSGGINAGRTSLLRSSNVL